jgi:hypothetical protein
MPTMRGTRPAKRTSKGTRIAPTTPGTWPATPNKKPTARKTKAPKAPAKP